MATVKNWHLGRDMLYKHEGARPKRQVGFVFDINRCIGCQTCTMSCRATWTFSKGQEYMWWNNVETKPYGGYPQHWDVQLLKELGAQSWEKGEYKGKTVFEDENEKLRDEPVGYLPDQKQWRFPNIYEDTSTGLHRRRGFASRASQLLLLPAADLQPLHLPRLPGRVPSKCNLQTRRRRYRSH